MQRVWYAVIVVIGIVLGLAIAGVPSRHHDAPLHMLTTTTSVVGAAPTSTTSSTSNPAHPPSSVKVVVITNSRAAIQAAGLVRQLKDAGYATDSSLTDTTDNLSRSEIAFAPGYDVDLGNVEAAVGMQGIPTEPYSTSPISPKLVPHDQIALVIVA